MRGQSAIAYEKATRLSPDHPSRWPLYIPVRHHLVRPTWRSAAQSLIKELPRTLTSREPLPDQIDCPCARKGSWEIYPEDATPQQTNVHPLAHHRSPAYTIPTDTATGPRRATVE